MRTVRRDITPIGHVWGSGCVWCGQRRFRTHPDSQRAYLRERVRIHADLVKANISGDIGLRLDAVARHAGA
jgi:hypothetical protein